MTTDGGATLRVDDLCVSYGVGLALDEVAVSAEPGEIVAILGSNGAGKSTLLRTIMGLVDPRRGEVSLGDESLTRLSTRRRTARGLALVPEGRRIFTDLSIEANLEVAAAPWRRFRHPVTGDLERVYEIFPILRERRRTSGGQLSGGQQQMLAIGRALMARPKVLLLDEPSLGLAPKIVREVMNRLREVADDGLCVVIAEQNVYEALRVADRGCVLANGRIALANTAASLRDDPRLAAAYLGGRTIATSAAGEPPTQAGASAQQRPADDSLEVR